MKISTIISISFFTANVQSITVREHKNIQKMLKSVEHNMFDQKVDQKVDQTVEQKVEQKVEQNVEQNVEQKSERTFERNAKLSFKTALESFTKCQKLRAKLMIKYRNNPRLVRRIKHLQLKC